MGKIRTDRQFYGGLLCMWVAASFLLGVVFCHARNIPGADMLKPAGLVFGIAAAAPLIISAGLWALRNRMDRGGARYMWKHYKLVLRLRKQLLEAGIYTTRKFGAAKWAEIPWGTAEFAPDFKSGRVCIKNSIQFHDRLGRMDISPSLGKYVVEQAYLSDDGNHYYFDFYDSSLVRKLSFGSLEEFRAYSGSLGAYELFVDGCTRLPLTHQLVVGQTGSGKSYALLGYALQMLLKPVKYHLYFADPKESGIALLGGLVSPETTAGSFGGIVALLETFVARMHERQQQRGMKNLSAVSALEVDGAASTFYVGSKKAGTRLFMRVYDKKMEQIATRGFRCREAAGTLSWVRFEVVFKGSYAHQLTDIIMDTGEGKLKDLIADKITEKFRFYDTAAGKYTDFSQALFESPQRQFQRLRLESPRDNDLASSLLHLANGSGLFPALYKCDKVWGEGASTLLLKRLHGIYADEYEPNEDVLLWLKKHKGALEGQPLDEMPGTLKALRDGKPEKNLLPGRPPENAFRPFQKGGFTE